MGKRILLVVCAAAILIPGLAWGLLYEPDISRSALEAKYAGAPSRFIVLPDGSRAHFRDRGPRGAPVLVLLHGSNSSLFDWEPWSKSLSDTFRVVSVDLPGHGLTGTVPNHDYSENGMTLFVRGFTENLGLHHFALAGNSMGGGVSARFAEIYPETVTHLILIDARGMETTTGDHIPLGFRLAGIPVVNRLLLHITPRPLVVEGLKAAIIRQSAYSGALVDTYWDFARMEGTRSATIERFRLQPDGYVRAHINQIRAPTLILWGKEDHLIPVAAAYSWASGIPGSKVIVYPSTGHLPMEEVARESAADTRAFLLNPRPL